MDAAKKTPEKIDVFLAGVIQGSQAGTSIESQDYRADLRRIFAEKLPELVVYCPFSQHSSSVDYDDELGRRVFLEHLEMCRGARLLVAFLPTASLGTAIELWECHKAGVPIVAISPMTHNWVLRFFADAILPDLKAFEIWLTRERFESLAE